MTKGQRQTYRAVWGHHVREALSTGDAHRVNAGTHVEARNCACGPRLIPEGDRIVVVHQPEAEDGEDVSARGHEGDSSPLALL